ncbi:MAG: hypothetical protein IJ363_07615 [Clostridia bacterium]|nr:hypothetical protein [Clostridia bacterium]
MNKTKTATRILSVLAALLLLITSLTACSGGVTREEAKTAMDSLLTALDNENYAEAAALYHPDAAMTEELLAALAEQVKTKVGIDLTEGATVEKITGISSSYYDSTVGGSRYELTAKIKAGDKTASLTVEVIRNDRGYGIFKVECNP